MGVREPTSRSAKDTPRIRLLHREQSIRWEFRRPGVRTTLSRKKIGDAYEVGGWLRIQRWMGEERRRAGRAPHPSPPRPQKEAYATNPFGARVEHVELATDMKGGPEHATHCYGEGAIYAALSVQLCRADRSPLSLTMSTHFATLRM